MKFVTWVPAACVALLAIIYAVLLPEAQQMRAYVRIGSTVFRVFPFLGQEISPEAAVIKMGIRYGIFSGLTPKTMEGVSAAATVHEEGGQHLDRQHQRALTQTFGKYNVYSSSSPPPQQQQSRSESDGTHPNKPTSGYTCEAVASVIEGVDVTWVTATTGGGGKNQILALLIPLDAFANGRSLITHTHTHTHKHTHTQSHQINIANGYRSTDKCV
mmetsp:Transcript_32217/g.52321  ORF Transcript_32217/g.52321 Transcript_32217/m.52321 type:complete len:215 (+) Transcript_32217:134-778(+)